MSNTNEIQTTEEQNLSAVQENASADGLQNVNTEPDAGQNAGFDVVLKDDETKTRQSPETNREFAERRLERKRQRELEGQAEAVRRGELPEDLRVKPNLPAQPNINDFLSDEGLAKYGYDQQRAMAAFHQANADWQMKAMDARSDAVAEQGRKSLAYTQQTSAYAEAARVHYDAAEKLNLPDFQEKEDAFRALVPQGLDTEIMALFPEKSAAILYHLGANPEKVRQLLGMSSQQALIELTRLSERLTIKPRGKQVSAAPTVDEPIQPNVTASNRASLEKQMSDAANKGDTDTYRKIKQMLKGIR